MQLESIPWTAMTTMGQWRRLRATAPRACEPGETSNYRVRGQGNLWADPLSNPSKPLSTLAGKLPGAGKRASAFLMIYRHGLPSPPPPLRLYWLMQIARLDNSIARTRKGFDLAEVERKEVVVFVFLTPPLLSAEEVNVLFCESY